jgi:hypothetical protein
MAHERLKNATLPQAFAEVLSDIGNLLQKEFRLAKAEIFAQVSTKLTGYAWFATAAILGLMAVFIALQAMIFAIASYGLAMHWACLIVAGLLGVIAAGAFLKGRADAGAHLAPDRAIHQVKRDIATAKEHWT